MKAFHVCAQIDDDLYDYLEFLERTQYVKNKNEILEKALILYKKLSAHDWLPDIYRMGESRVVIIERGMLLDLFDSLKEQEIYKAGSMTALKRKVLKPELKSINLTKDANWRLVTDELQNMGWGSFKRNGAEIRVENAAVPAQYLKGYLETMFKVGLGEQLTDVKDHIIFKVTEPK